MTSFVTTSRHENIGVITVDNPPVNALSNAVRQGLYDAILSLNADGVDAIVITCAGKTFIAGADIREFGTERTGPTLAELCDMIEASAKPVIAAIHGTALGGGFEIALAAHYRIALADAHMGLPEIKLGRIPGAGGLNRLARIAGTIEALELAIKGDPITAQRALGSRIVDRMVESNLQSAAIDYANTLALEQAGPRPTRACPIPPVDAEEFAAAVRKLTAKSRGQDAPAAIVESLHRAQNMNFDDAIAADREAFAILSAGSQSRALRHMFFAERQAGKITHGTARPIRNVAILGAGTMGGGIAMSFAAASVPVTLIDMDDSAVTRGMDRIRGNYATSVKRGSISAAEADRRLSHITPATQRSAAADADADLVIEAVFENMDLKKEIFADLENICRPDTILASNTSALNVDEIAATLNNPGRFVGMHFFSPANVMKLCEIVVANTTDADTIATVAASAKAINKVPVVAGNCDGFIGNRMVARRSAQAERLLQEGALPQQVDQAIREFGFAMGPLQTNDMSGLDVGYAIRKRRGTKFHIADAIVESGRLGQKTGAGYYRYADGSRDPIPDDATTKIIQETSRALGIERRDIDPREMIERMVFALINEGARIVEEGIALRPSDVDVVWIYGYGFPRWRGGPLAYADEIGLPYIVQQLTHYAATSGDESLVPAPLLRRLAEEGSRFSLWQKQQASAQ
jgi:3-hydroxyacyl-CoA dehydrogenase